MYTGDLNLFSNEIGWSNNNILNMRNRPPDVISNSDKLQKSSEQEVLLDYDKLRILFE